MSRTTHNNTNQGNVHKPTGATTPPKTSTGSGNGSRNGSRNGGKGR